MVVPLPGTTFGAKPVVEYLSERLADFTVPLYKVPQYFAVSDVPLPRNPGGKIVKRPLRESTDWGPPVR